MKEVGIINWLRWDSDSVDLDLADFTKLMNQNTWRYSKHNAVKLIIPERYLLELWEIRGTEGFWLERPVPLWEDPDDEDTVSPFTDPNSQFYLDRDVAARDGVDPSSSIMVVGSIDDEVFPDYEWGGVLPDEVVDYLAPLTFTYWESEMWWLVDDPNFANEFVAYLNKHGEEVLTDENWKAFKAWKKGGDDAAWK